MKLIRKISQRLTGVLGHDCDGKPLRAGDEVVLVGERHGRWRGVATRVVGPCPVHSGMVEIEIGHPEPKYKWYSARPGTLRRINHPDSASWDQVTESTGWKPRVEAPVRTEEVGL